MNLWPLIAAIHTQALAHFPAPRYRLSVELSNRLADGSVMLATVRAFDTARDVGAMQTFGSHETNLIDSYGSAERFGANVAHALRRELEQQGRKTAKSRRKP
jgi:hypothetical protein